MCSNFFEILDRLLFDTMILLTISHKYLFFPILQTKHGYDNCQYYHMKFYELLLMKRNMANQIFVANLQPLNMSSSKKYTFLVFIDTWTYQSSWKRKNIVPKYVDKVSFYTCLNVVQTCLLSSLMISECPNKLKLKHHQLLYRRSYYLCINIIKPIHVPTISKVCIFRSVDINIAKSFVHNSHEEVRTNFWHLILCVCIFLSW